MVTLNYELYGIAAQLIYREQIIHRKRNYTRKMQQENKVALFVVSELGVGK